MTIDEARRRLETIRSRFVGMNEILKPPSGVGLAEDIDAIDTALRALDVAVDWIAGEWQYPGETWEQAKAKVHRSIKRDITKAAAAPPPPPGGPDRSSRGSTS